MSDTAVIMVAALSGGGFPALLLFARWLLERRDKKRQQQTGITKTFRHVHNIYAALSLAMREARADRVLLLRAHNGGAIPRPGVKLYSSVVYEVHSPDVEPARDSWQKQPLDEHYISLLLKVATHGQAHMVTTKMHDCDLRDAYEASGVRESRIVEVKAREGEYFYLSISWHSERAAADESELRTATRVAVTKVRDALEMQGAT